MQDKLTKQVLGLLGVGLVIVIGVWLVKNNKVEEEISPEITLESSKMMDGGADLKLPMTEVEKQVIEEAFLSEGVEMTVLKDVSEGQAVGTAWRQASETKYSHKIEVNNLPTLEKGFFYEGWLVGDEGFFSTGRMAEVAGEGKLYYTSDEDKSDYRGVVITLEPEDGEEAPADHVLEGSF